MNPSGADAAVGERGTSATPAAQRPGAEYLEYLLFTCRGVACAAPLHELREVLRAVPPSVPIPFSPAWLLGVFTLRTDLLGLVDPAPMLFGAAWAESISPVPAPVATLIVGFDEARLGLAVGPIGEIVAIRPNEIEPIPLPDDASAVPNYIRGRYQSARSPESYAVVDLAPFIAALLRALGEGADHA